MPTIRPYLLLFAAAFATIAGAQQNDSVDAPHATFREGIIASCEQQYSVEQCKDEQFLEDNFHLKSLEVAQRTAARRSQLQRAALRELTLQRACNQSLSNVCGAAEDPQQCATNLVQSCSMLSTQAATCLQNAKTSCATNSSNACIEQQAARCPSIKKQPIDVLVAKYPKLTLTQKNQLANTAQQLDATQSNWPTNLLGLLSLLSLL